MEEIPINADTTNKALDMIDESTKETRKELDKTGAKGVNKLAQLLWASPIGRKADICIAERPYKMEKELKKMQAKYDNIPVEYQVEPTSYIALKGVNELSYALEEEHLKEMFENLLIADMDSRKQNKALPAYIEIIKQLNRDDAKLLKLLYKNEYNVCAISLQLHTENKEGYSELDNYIIYNFKINNGITGFSTLKLNPLVIDNLLMHRLIEVDYTRYYPDCNDQYETLFNSVKNRYKLKENSSLSYEKGIIKLTNFGLNFIEICLS